MIDFNLSKGNNKTGKCLTVNLAPCLSCNHAAPCYTSGLCYANHGNWRFKAVQERLINNAKSFIENPKTVKNIILKETANYRGFFRWHSAGDILNMDYLEMMIDIAYSRPNIQFLAFTKKYNLVNKYLSYGRIPDNMTIIFSLWQGWQCDNPYHLPEALVTLKGPAKTWIKDARLSDNAFSCAGSCENCRECWHLSTGCQVVFHEH